MLSLLPTAVVAAVVGCVLLDSAALHSLADDELTDANESEADSSASVAWSAR